MQSRTRARLASSHVWLWLIAGLALVLRLLLVPHGLPYELDPDERLFVEAAWQVVESGSGDPGWYPNPAATLIDVMALPYALIAFAGGLFGQSNPVVAAGEAYRADVSLFFMVGRVVTVASGVFVVLMTYLLARELRISAGWAYLAALLMAISPAMIEFSAIVRSDMLMVLFILAAVVMSMRALVHPSARTFVAAGVLVGLAAASKYTGALAVVPVVVANATLVVRGKVSPRRGLYWLAGTAAGGLLIALLVGPYLFLNGPDAIRDFAMEARSQHFGATGKGLVRDMWRYLSEGLPWGLGVITSVVGLGGLILTLRWGRPRITGISFGVLLAAISFLALWWTRWVLPLLPLVAVGAVFALDRAQRRWGPRWARLSPPAVVILAGMVLVVPLLPRTLELVWTSVTRDDIRLVANEWIKTNIPRGSSLLIDTYTTQVSANDYDVYMLWDEEIRPWPELSPKARPDGYRGILAGEFPGNAEELLAAIEGAGIDYISLTDLWIDMVRAEAELYPRQMSLYDTLLDTYPTVARFDERDGRNGWPITVLQVVSEPGSARQPRDVVAP